METRIERKFTELKQRQRKGFVAYVCAGDPSLRETEDVVLSLEDAGADIVELGIPFSDPLADGRTNQEAAARALEGGATVGGVLACVERIRRRSEIPLLFFTYLNPLHAYGFKAVARDAAAAGADGFLVLDLPVEEGDEVTTIFRAHGLDNICLVAPTSTGERIAKTVRRGSGFVYCVSREGVTGVQQQVSRGAADLVRRTRARTDLPIALGFGISTPEQARTAAREADAIVVGSAIVKAFHEAPHTAAGRRRVARWIRTLVDGANAS